MERNEVFDKVLQRLKDDYNNGPKKLHIPDFEEKITGQEKYSRYICESLRDLGIVTPENHNGKAYMWTVMLNAKGYDWIDRNGSWSEFQEATDAPVKYGVRITPKNVEILNRTFLWLLHPDRQSYFDSLNELTNARQIEKYEHFICSELDEWITSENISGCLQLVSIDNDTELEIFVANGMFNYLLEPKKKDQSSLDLSNLTLNVNTQNVNISIITEALTTHLTPDQIEELKKVIASAKDETDKKKKIIKKLGSFGQGVAEKVLANILSKGETWQAIGKGLEGIFQG